MDPLSPSNINAGWASSPPGTPSTALGSSTSTSTSYSPRDLSASGSSINTYTPGSQGSFKEARVYGAPSPGLVRPPGDVGQQQQQPASAQGGGQGRYVRVRIGGLERNRKDMLVRFDASTNLPGYRTTLYKNMQRSYVEFQRFAEQVQLTSPQTIIPSLPLATTSAVTDEEDDRLVRIALQRWFTRVCDDPVVQRDDELRLFIESDFGYNPAPPPSARKPAGASASATNVLSAALSKVVRRGPLDEDEELAGAKGALEKLEGGWGGAAASVNAMGKARRAHALANQDVGSKLISLSTVESDFSLAGAQRKMGRSLEQLSNMAAAQAASENVVLSDSFGYQALNARAAKASLAQRTQILEDSQTASKAAITKRRNVERLKGSSSINPNKVDDAINEMNDANELEESLSKRLNAISQNLHVALRQHSRQTHEDVALALLENARLTLGYHKHTLRELEALRPDLARIGTVGQASASASVSSQSGRMGTQAPAIPNVPATMGGASGLRSTGPFNSNASASASGAGGAGMAPGMAPSMSSRNYASPPRAPMMEGSRSMFLPPPTQNSPQRPNSAGPTGSRMGPSPGMMGPAGGGGMRPDPLAGSNHGGQQGMHHGGMAQSMVLPGQQAGGYNGYQQQQGQAYAGYPGRAGPGGYAGGPGPIGPPGQPGQPQAHPGQQGHMGQGYPGRGGTVGRAGARRLDERQAAKLLAGGF